MTSVQTGTQRGFRGLARQCVAVSQILRPLSFTLKQFQLPLIHSQLISLMAQIGFKFVNTGIRFCEAQVQIFTLTLLPVSIIAIGLRGLGKADLGICHPYFKQRQLTTECFAVLRGDQLSLLHHIANPQCRQVNNTVGHGGDS